MTNQEAPQSAGLPVTNVDRVLVSGMAWTAVLRWSAQVVSWVATAIAARLLLPGDYGLIGMAMLAIGLVRMVEDFGMDAVLVQDRSIEGDRQARVAGLILVVGVSLSIVFILLSQFIAQFFREPQVASLISVLSALCIADAVQVIPRAELQRRMEFRRLAWLQFIQVLTTQATVVTGAYLGWGVWALVLNTLAGSLVVTVLLLYWSPFTVRWPRGLRELAAPLLQGWRILASRFAYYAYSSADQTVIGRVLGKEALGAYSFAMTFSTTISQEISSVFSRVVPGVFSSVQHLQSELRRYFLVLTELLCYLAMPVSFGIAVTADLMVELVLGPQWEAVVAPLRILCIYSAFYSSQVLIGHVLLWTGRFRANMWCSVLAAVLLPLGCYVGSSHGLAGVAWAWALLFPIANLPAFYISFRAINIRIGEWFGALLPALVGSGAMILVVLALRSVLPVNLSLPVMTTACVVGGALAYVSVVLMLFRRRLLRMRDFLAVIRSSKSLDAELGNQAAASPL